MNISSLRITNVFGAIVTLCIFCPPTAESFLIAFYLVDRKPFDQQGSFLIILFIILFMLVFSMIIFFKKFIRNYEIDGCRDRALAIISIYSTLMTFVVKLGWVTKSIMLLLIGAFLARFCHDRLKKISSKVFSPLLYSSQASLLIIGSFFSIRGFYNDDLEKFLLLYIGVRCILSFFLVRIVTNYYKCYPNFLELKKMN